jgi:hypothetical protein
VTISAGVAPFQGAEPKSIQAWLNEADAALYRAKQQGRNCVAHEPQSLVPSPVPSLEKVGSGSK